MSSTIYTYVKREFIRDSLILPPLLMIHPILERKTAKQAYMYAYWSSFHVTNCSVRYVVLNIIAFLFFFFLSCFVFQKLIKIPQ